MKIRVILDTTTGLYKLIGNQKIPLSEIEKFFEVLNLRGLSINTIRSYAYDLVILFRWMEGINKSFSELVENDLIDFISVQRKNGDAPSSINHRLTTCRIFYRFLTGKEMESGSLVSVPSGYYKGQGRDKDLGIHTVRRKHKLVLQVVIPKTIIEPLTSEQVRTFLSGFRRFRDIAIIHLMLLCGMRSKEVITIKTIDIELAQSLVRICGKGNKERNMPLPQIITDMIREYLRLERPKNCTNDALFVVLQGKRRGCSMTLSGLRSLFRYWRDQLGINEANPHRFRHTFGTDMARAGVPLPVLQKMMGHATCSTTMQYINLSMTDVAEEYQQAMAIIKNRYQG